jgi:Leucine-rich repeat (LRR) protein
MHCDHLDSQIEIKNENFPTLKACSLDFCRRLVHLNLSMNNISIVDGGFECVNLKTLILSDNLIKEIKPSMLLKLPSLRVLNLDMN